MFIDYIHTFKAFIYGYVDARRIKLEKQKKNQTLMNGTYGYFDSVMRICCVLLFNRTIP